jgi:hypothetical protein
MLGYSEWSVPFRFPDRNFESISHLNLKSSPHQPLSFLSTTFSGFAAEACDLRLWERLSEREKTIDSLCLLLHLNFKVFMTDEADKCFADATKPSAWWNAEAPAIQSAALTKFLLRYFTEGKHHSSMNVTHKLEQTLPQTMHCSYPPTAHKKSKVFNVPFESRVLKLRVNLPPRPPLVPYHHRDVI